MINVGGLGMNFLVLYSTIEGQTRKIAEAVASHLETQGHMVMLTDANQVGFADPGTSDGAILCAPVHIGRYPSPFVHYVHDWGTVLNDMPSAFISVSLSIASADEEEKTEARDYPVRLADETGWKPRFVLHCAGALKYTEYDFFKRWMLKRIASAEGGPIDTKHDHELTNWTEIKRFVDDILRALVKERNLAGE
ncbi:menaquinone-dependent protoporphyrinogen oxidase [Phyllobacterium trifolii]|uniref:Menaquinone-dependent protoporphyrinogen oxidase n=1 Tax=Phyllobacterium trifolii TaxID=300193 RepID=A0A839U6T6_9HYPH|nr:flavodoxin domain-containing protein [Phyllobacterium trifolii]MBB3146846.1 menaquinone-dependent protoporphyrinogen oxidase [Phyllobacterium trifolii]